MREKGDSLVLVTTDRKLRHRFTLGVPSTFDQDCLKLKMKELGL